MPAARGYAAAHAGALLTPFTVPRRDPGPHDVQLRIAYCGVCHSDLHQVRNEWGGGRYPMVPGHEIIGQVTATGSAVTRFRDGDRVGVGCMVGSCGTCTDCAEGLEQFCTTDTVWTYNSPEVGGGHTFGGYSTDIVVDERFVLRVPETLDPAAAAPLLCAGITTYSPLRRWNLRAGQTLGVVGLGGLGHMAVKFGHAMGARVVLFTTSPAKVADGLRLGADDVIVSTDRAAMKRMSGRCDLIVDAVSAPHDLNALLALLRRDGVLVLVGMPETPTPVRADRLIDPRRLLTGSLVGGIAETQAMLDFCGERGIVSEIETIAMDGINAAFDRMVRGDVRYRFVIDLATVRD
jgi:alcohol dehydrogenase (NADP+)